MERLKKLKLKPGVIGNDEFLKSLLQDAEDTVLDMIGRDVLPQRLESVVVELALIAYNRQGTEGETSRSEGGMSASFLNDLPPYMQRRLLNYPRKVRVMRDADDAKQA